MLDDASLERIPPLTGVARPAGQAAPNSVEDLIGQCLRSPEQAQTDRHRDLLEALGRGLDAGFGGDTDALLDVHRSAYAVYETILGHPLAAGARHERSAWLNTFRSVYEDRVLAADLAEVADRLPSASDASRPDFVRAWFIAEAQKHDPLDLEVETFLAEEADIAQFSAFILADGYLNYRFFDALVLAQLHFMESVKHEISLHMWDESGEGKALAAHTLQFTRSLRHLGLELPTTPPWEDWRPYAGHNLYFILAGSRRHYFKALGSLAMPELFDVQRDVAVVRGLERLGYHPESDFEYYYNHMEGDSEHGPEWLDGVVAPIVASEPDAGLELMRGGALRMLAMRRYNGYLAERVCCTEPVRSRGDGAGT
jgi:hypothetical protein